MDNGYENLERNNGCVDYIITHSPPASVIALLGQGLYEQDRLTQYLENIRVHTDIAILGGTPSSSNSRSANIPTIIAVISRAIHMNPDANMNIKCKTIEIIIKTRAADFIDILLI